MEWSLRCIRANSVLGMWQEMHRLASLSAGWWLWAATFLTRSSWQGRQALLNFSFLKR